MSKLAREWGSSLFSMDSSVVKDDFMKKLAIIFLFFIFLADLSGMSFIFQTNQTYYYIETQDDNIITKFNLSDYFSRIQKAEVVKQNCVAMHVYDGWHTKFVLFFPHEELIQEAFIKDATLPTRLLCDYSCGWVFDKKEYNSAKKLYLHLSFYQPPPEDWIGILDIKTGSFKTFNSDLVISSGKISGNAYYNTNLDVIYLSKVFENDRFLVVVDPITFTIQQKINLIDMWKVDHVPGICDFYNNKALLYYANTNQESWFSVVQISDSKKIIDPVRIPDFISKLTKYYLIDNGVVCIDLKSNETTFFSFLKRAFFKIKRSSLGDKYTVINKRLYRINFINNSFNEVILE